MEEKCITFYMEEKGLNNAAISVNHGYYETLTAINNGEKEIHTTQLCLLHTSLFGKGYKVYVVEKNNDMFEIKLGENKRTNRKIKEGHNLEHLLIAGEFNKTERNEDSIRLLFDELIKYLKVHDATYGFKHYEDGELYFYFWSYGNKYDITYGRDGFVFCCKPYETMELLIKAIHLQCRGRF